jgi:hypothetical protein
LGPVGCTLPSKNKLSIAFVFDISKAFLLKNIALCNCGIRNKLQATDFNVFKVK